MRTQQIKQYLADGVFAVEPRFLQGLLDTVNSGDVQTKAETNNDVAESHSYEVLGDVAVITVDGATTKKNTWINAACGGLVGYDTISNYLSKAESDTNVNKILLHLDTVGGDVAGVDNLQELIKTSQKETITLYDNVGASAGVWYGTASDKIYATPMTEIGSIGVMAGYYEPRKDDKKVVLVSHNAQNKTCKLNGDCKNKIQSKIDHIESIFHSRVSANTGLSKEEIIKYFNYGDTVSSEKALEVGFIDGITSKKDLLKSLATMPSAEKIANSTKGDNVPKETKTTATVDTTIEANQVDGGVDIAAAVAEARTEEANRIKTVQAVIPAVHRDNEKVIAKLYDVDTTVEGMKAFLYDVDAKIAKDAKETAAAVDETVNNDMLSIDSASAVKDEDCEELAIVNKLKGAK